MHLLVRAVITGFGLALGAALYHKVARELGFEDPDDKAKQDDERAVAPGEDVSAERDTD